MHCRSDILGRELYTIMKKLQYAYTIIAVLICTISLVACDGANSMSATRYVGRSESADSGGYTLALRSAASGHRNRTFTLSAEELAQIRVESTSESGELTLVISHNGNLDGSEIRLDISNFSGYVDASQLSPGRIRFAFHFDDVRNTDTKITWR